LNSVRARRRGPHARKWKLYAATQDTALRAGRPPITLPGRFLVLISVRGSGDSMAIVRLEGLGQLKNPTILGIETATFRLLA
jgi:hypothetical protein